MHRSRSPCLAGFGFSDLRRASLQAACKRLDPARRGGVTSSVAPCSSAGITANASLGRRWMLCFLRELVLDEG